MTDLNTYDQLNYINYTIKNLIIQAMKDAYIVLYTEESNLNFCDYTKEIKQRNKIELVINHVKKWSLINFDQKKNC